MSDHTMEIRLGWPTIYTLVCTAPEAALCRAVWSCECTSWDRSGVDAQGPWHDVYDELSPIETVRHYGTAGGECNEALFINEADDVETLGRGTIRVPVRLTWIDEGYEWEVANE